MKKYVYIIAAFFIIVTIISISIYDYKKLNQNNYYQNTPDVSLDIQLPVTTTNIWNAINELNKKDLLLKQVKTQTPNYTTKQLQMLKVLLLNSNQ